MKVFASKQRQSLTVLPRTTTQQRSRFETNASAIKESFDGWLHSVATLKNEHTLPVPKAYRAPRLTALDVSRVNQATIREGESHRVWPPAIIEQFNNAKVITTREIEHYVVKDTSLTRIEYKGRGNSNSRSTVLQMLSERD